MPRREQPDPLAFKLGKRVQTLRRERGLSQGALANASGIAKGHLSSFEQGLVMITVPTIEALARALDVTPGYIMTFPEDSELDAMFEILHDLPAERRREIIESVTGDDPKGSTLGGGKLPQVQRAKPLGRTSIRIRRR
jgi:transcriptional regulator with XRE-family HTH domain